MKWGGEGGECQVGCPGFPVLGGGVGGDKGCEFSDIHSFCPCLLMLRGGCMVTLRGTVGSERAQRDGRVMG